MQFVQGIPYLLFGVQNQSFVGKQWKTRPDYMLLQADLTFTVYI